MYTALSKYSWHEAKNTVNVINSMWFKFHCRYGTFHGDFSFIFTEYLGLKLKIKLYVIMKFFVIMTVVKTRPTTMSSISLHYNNKILQFLLMLHPLLADPARVSNRPDSLGADNRTAPRSREEWDFLEPSSTNGCLLNLKYQQFI